MTLKEGRRVKLATELRLAGEVEPADAPSAGTGVGAAYLALAAGTEGTVERVNEHRHQSQEVREYERLKSLLDDFGPQMPPGSRKQLEERVGSLEPAWIAYQEQRLRVTVRVRFDNGFVLADAPGDLFTPA
ncbi:hypothetical protein AB0M38_28625 [Streptomyces sp. NPDC051742]|uniref:hypothetical protein n=1 Tax=unclassified Streptomyces TaxID=2593676 RepID=UPI003430587A